MKKMIIPAIAALLFCGAANAQMTQKPAQKGITSAVAKTTTQKKPVSTTTSVTPVKTKTSYTETAPKKHAAITRKHHNKAKPKVKPKKQ